jgi:copper chaperone CopZ
MILERIEDKLHGVVKAEASYHKAQMIVEFNETQVNESQIKAEIQRMGYEAITLNQN